MAHDCETAVAPRQSPTRPERSSPLRRCLVYLSRLRLSLPAGSTRRSACLQRPFSILSSALGALGIPGVRGRLSSVCNNRNNSLSQVALTPKLVRVDNNVGCLPRVLRPFSRCLSIAFEFDFSESIRSSWWQWAWIDRLLFVEPVDVRGLHRLR